MTNKTTSEICQIEGNDEFHDYGGGHGNKGNDFAKFWLMSELMRLSKANAKNFLFLLEYVQDVAYLDESASPTAITLYQLKKRENRPWDLNSLAGLTKKNTTVKPGSPLAKLLRSILHFAQLDAQGEFVSNAKYDVDLHNNASSLALDYLTLDLLAETKQKHLRDGAAHAHGVPANKIPLNRVTLRHVPLEINDMRVHIIGVAHGFLKEFSAGHAAQADAFVDALYAKLSTYSRQTSKCQTWDELVIKRGYSKAQFDEALAELNVLPDLDAKRTDLLKKLATSLDWHSRDTMRVHIALADILRLKLTQGEVNLAGVNVSGLHAINSLAEAAGWSEEEEFAKTVDFLMAELPNELLPRIRAFAIYTMVEAWTNQIYA